MSFFFFDAFFFSGRVINRFVTDVAQVDDLLSMSMEDFMLCFLSVLAPFVFAILAFPYIAVVMPFIFYVVVKTLRYVTHTMNELKRLDGVTRSSVLSVLAASLYGLSPIRAMGSEDVQKDAFMRHLRTNAKVCFFWLASQRFYSFVIDSTMTGFIGIVVAMAIVLRNYTDPALMALALVYSLQLVIYVQFAARR